MTVLIIGGLLGAFAAGIDPVVGVAPGAAAVLVQHVVGHTRAWRSTGVERAFVLESAAISFYVSVVCVLIVAVLQSSGVVDHVDATTFVVGGLFVDSRVRSWRESRFV